MHSRLSDLFLVGLLVLGLCGCQPSDEDSVTTDIAVVPKGTTHEFWKSIHAGALKAREELTNAGHDVEITWEGPLKEDDREGQIQVVENFTTREFDGIVLAPLDSKALVRPVEAAVKSGIPVVIVDSALESETPVSFVATDNYKGGRVAGEHLGELLGGKGDVILLRYQVGSASTEKREKGFMDVMKESYPGINILSADQYAGATRETAYQNAESLINRYGDEVEGVFCPCEPVTVAMTKALRDFELAGGQVKVVGFDASDQSVTDLKKGDVQALVVQDPVRMGRLGVKTLFKHLKGKRVRERIDTGVTLVTQENMDEPDVKKLLNPPLEQYLQ